MVPTFLLQPLAENAIKYGMLTSPMPMLLTVIVEKNAAVVLIKIINSGKLIPYNYQHHTNNGITNTKARLDLMFPGKADLILSEDNGNVIVNLTISNNWN